MGALVPLAPLAGIPYPTAERALLDGARAALSGQLLGPRGVWEEAWMYAGEHSACSPLEAPYAVGYALGLLALVSD